MKNKPYALLLLLTLGAATRASAHSGPHSASDIPHLALHLLFDHWYVAIPIATLAGLAMTRYWKQRRAG